MRPTLPLYVLKEVWPWYLGGVVLFLSLQLTNLISITAGLLISYRATLPQAAGLFADQLPGYLNRCLVLSVPFAVLLAFGRLAKDSELKASLAAGVSPLRLLWPLLLPTLLIGGAAYYNAGWLTPAGNARWWNAWYGVYNQSPPPPSTQGYTYAQGERFFSAGRVQNDSGGRAAQLTGVLVVQGESSYSSPSGVWDAAAHTWTVRDGAVVGRDGVPRPISAPISFPQRDTLRRPSLPPDQASTPDLRSQLAALGAARAGGLPGQGEREIAFELSRRLADPFTPLAFALAAGALGLLLRDRAWGAASVIVFIFAFYVVWSTAPELARAGALSPLSAAWLPNGLFFAFALALAWRLR